MILSRRAFLATAAAVALVGCGDDDADDAADRPADGDDATSGTSTETTADTAPLDLPTNDEAALIAMFDPFFAPLDQKVTRAGLFDLEAGFVRDDEATHMAIYVEPIDPAGDGWDDAKYLETVAPGMAAITPFLFDTWSDLASMDLCQEPPQAVAPEEEPPIETQVFLTREDSAGIDWESDVTLAALIEARLRSPETARVSARPGLEGHPLWVAAASEAQERVTG